MTTSYATATPPRANRLAREKSPYLLQHQYNPVDWQPWGEEAFAQARREDKPIFLSIGYSTCHWCHVMERESFENEEVARVLNRHFVSIKMDREERPDVDKIYMTFVQATTGQGGWPLNVFLTPDLKPFYGGTYFPPANAHGRPGFAQLLDQIRRAWQERKADLAHSASDMHARLEQALAASVAPSGDLPGPDLLHRAAALLKQVYDPIDGGFGRAPKFPQPSQPQLLLRCASRFDDSAAAQMVLHTCERMAAGGIHDQLGGGFSRYSVDSQWLVPHFEKMLYDNAQLAQLYLDAYLVSGRPLLADVARDILEYVLRDMTDPAGGFYSAEDADSEGHEGKFYCWSRAELRELLSPAEFDVAARYFGLTEQGNFIDHSHPQPLPNQNVLRIVSPALSPAEEKLLAAARQKMLAARSQRVRPHRDDKVLSSWNGLMLGAFARGYAVLNETKYLHAAERNLAFLQNHLWDEATGTLHHRWREGERDQVQLLEAYAFLLSGAVELYEAALNPRCLEFASALAEALIRKFYDAEHGGFWQSAPGSGDLIFRLKEDQDGAEPSGNSVATLALLKLGQITGRKEFSDAGRKTLLFFAARLVELPQALPFMLQALDFAQQEPSRAVVTGNPSDPTTRRLLQAIHSQYQPNKVVLGTGGPVEEFSRTLADQKHPAVYFCTGTACQPPTDDPEAIQAALSVKTPSAQR
jgi:uncharacterized protein